MFVDSGLKYVPPPSFDDETPVLEYWSIVGERPSDPYADPSVFSVVKLEGTVTGHPEKKDGSVITTSALLRLQQTCATTLSRVYRLGVPCAHFVEWCQVNNKNVWFTDLEVNTHYEFTPDARGVMYGRLRKP